MDSLRIGLEWFLNPDHVPLLVAKRAGIFAAHDLDVSWIEPAQHMDAVDEIRAGRMDVAITEPIHLVQDLAKGDELVGFARFLHTNGGVMYLQGDAVKRPADMAGLRVQYPGAPGLTYDFSMSSDYYARLATWLHTSGQTATVTPTAGAWTNDLAW